MRVVFGGLALLTLVACAPAIPESGPGVGFGSYSEYQRQQAQGGVSTTGAVTPMSAEEQLAADTAAALNSGETPLNASPANPAPQIAVNSTGISDENNFENVSALRSIESDKQHIANNRAQYQVVQPTALPSRTGDEGPNIVAFAVRTTHPVGQKMYARFGTSQSRAARGCAKYASADQAQAAFLSKGGPQKDRLGIDPDGDGYACTWDPSPFRHISQASVASDS